MDVPEAENTAYRTILKLDLDRGSPYIFLYLKMRIFLRGLITYINVNSKIIKVWMPTYHFYDDFKL